MACALPVSASEFIVGLAGLSVHFLRSETVAGLPLSLFHVQIGTYNPIASSLDGVKEVRLKMDRVKYWLSVGAQPSDTFAKLLASLGVLPQPPIRFNPQASVPKADRKKFSTLAGGSGSFARGSSFSGLFQATLGVPSASLSPAFMRVRV